MYIKYFLSLLISLFITSSVFAQEKLLFAADLIRHGDRTPIHDIPQSPYQWKEGLGELTAEGMNQEFQLGMAFRKRYIDEFHLLPPHYNAASFYVRSTDINRALMSAQSLLYGFYPLGSGPALPDGSPALPSGFQPIPIHTVPQEEDNLLLAKQSKNLIMIYNLYRFEKKAWEEKTKGLEKKLIYWKKITGIDTTDPQKINMLADDIKIYQLHHVPLPKGLSQQDIQEITELGKWAFVTYFQQKEVTHKMGHTFLMALADYFRQVTRSKTTLKYVLFSGHDTSLMSVMNTLGAPVNEPPPYASHINFSLFENEKKYYVKMSFNDQPIVIPDCNNSNTCTLEQFITLANK